MTRSAATCLRVLPLLALAVVVATAARAAPVKDDGREDQGESLSDAPSHAKKPLWIDTGVGYQRVDLTTIRVARSRDGDPLTADLVPQVIGGPTAHVGIGGRIMYFTLGVDLTATLFDQMTSRGVDGSLQLYSVDAQFGMRFPFGRVEPYVQLAGGYSVFGGFGDAIDGLGRGLDVDGANARIGAGLDYFVIPNFAIGVRSTFEFLFLARQGESVRDLTTARSVNTVGEAKARLLQGDGSSIGTAFGVTVGPSLHF